MEEGEKGGDGGTFAPKPAARWISLWQMARFCVMLLVAQNWPQAMRVVMLAVVLVVIVVVSRRCWEFERG